SQEDDFRPSDSNNALPKKILFVYLAISGEAASAVLLVVRQGKQHPVHYVSRTLHDAKRNYTPLEKMTLALRHVSRRLRRYFEAHPITVITDQPLKQILSKADMSGRVAPYAVELGEHNITYEHRNVIKGQVLADFINEIPVDTLDVPSMDVQEINAVVEEEGETWMTPIINCLERETCPEDQNKARALRMKISQYVMEERVLFKRSYLMPMLLRVGALQASYWGMDVLGPLPEAPGKARNKASRVENLGTLGLKWEGPYMIVEAYQNGSYKMRTMDDMEVPRVWHAINLRNATCRDHCV
nr:reverse transcriptase domain-containing protein [Tanacetum cinerariifolium]